MLWRDYLKGLADFLLPRYCAACGGVLLRKEKLLCMGCETGLPLTYFWNEAHNPMADKFNAQIQDKMADDGYEAYSAAAALFFYKGDFKNLTKMVKYHGNEALGRKLGGMLGEKLGENECWKDVDMVIPVPLHRSRRFRRGYNQAEIIAAALACRMDRGACLLKTDVLTRRRRTRSQATLSVEDKARNVAGAFAVKDGSLAVGPEVLTADQHGDGLGRMPAHVLLVDDVFTTGSTLCECHRAIRKALVEKYGPPGRKVRISAATLAYVGE